MKVVATACTLSLSNLLGRAVADFRDFQGPLLGLLFSKKCLARGHPCRGGKNWRGNLCDRDLLSLPRCVARVVSVAAVRRHSWPETSSLIRDCLKRRNLKSASSSADASQNSFSFFHCAACIVFAVLLRAVFHIFVSWHCIKWILHVFELRPRRWRDGLMAQGFFIRPSSVCRH